MINAAIKAATAQAAQQEKTAGYQAYILTIGILRQITVVWQGCSDEYNLAAIAAITSINEMEQHAERGISYVKTNHRITGKKDSQDGAVAGSAPIWGVIQCLNTLIGGKIFADALMLKMAHINIPE